MSTPIIVYNTKSFRVVDAPRTAKSHKSHASPSLGGSASDSHGAWEAERQIVLDENQELRKKCAELEAALAKTLEESAAQARNAADVITDNQTQIEELQQSVRDSEDRIDELKVEKMALLRRATEAEERESQLKNRVEILECGQPWPPTGAASGRRDPASSRNEVSLSGPSRAAAPDQEVSAGPGPSQQASGITSTPRARAVPTGRNAWPLGDEELLVRLIALLGPRDRGPQYSKIERVWKDNYPDRIPRDQGQLKDKAWNIKAQILM